MPEPISDLELRALIDSEVRAAMGELTGDLSSERAVSMDYYLGENSGKLRQDDPDRSSVVMTTVRDTVEWIMPQLMRMFARPDAVVEFDAIDDEDEERAKEETKAINHIFWRENEGFLILETWFKDALLQKDGIVKWYIEEREEREEEKYDGVTPIGLVQLEADPEVEAVDTEESEIPSIGPFPLQKVTFQRKKKCKYICVENIPPEEFLISSDARSLSINGKNPPRFVGHYTTKTQSELREMGFSETEIHQMIRASDRWWDKHDQEDVARYHLSDEDPAVSGQQEAHKSQRKIHLVEAYVTVDRNGDGYAELLKCLRAGDFLRVEPAKCRPFAAITPVILPHKFFGLGEGDMMQDLQEINTSVMRNVMDNIYQTNNARPVVNDSVDLDSLLTSRPGAPIYVEGVVPPQQALMPYAPPPLWKDGLTLLEYFEGVRKDRTGVGDETQGLDPSTLANANTGVMLQAMEAARAKIELIARNFAETGMKWLFRGLHDLCRDEYDQPLTYGKGKSRSETQPQQWRKRSLLTVNVGVASGNKQQKQFALTQIAAIQEKMIRAGGLGVTLLPSNVYQLAVDAAESLEQDGDRYFFNPMLRQLPQAQQMIQAQMPQQGPDPQMALLQANMQAEQGRTQVAAEKAQLDARIKEAELQLKQQELAQKTRLETMNQQLQALEAQAKNQTETDKAEMTAAAKAVEADIKVLQTEIAARQEQQQAAIDQYRAELQSYTQLEAKRMELAQKEREAADQALAQAKETESTFAEMVMRIGDRLDELASKVG